MNKFNRLLLTLGVATIISACASTGVKEGALDYHNQDRWTFVSGKMQSPINISTGSVVKSNEMGILHLRVSNEIRYVKDNGHSIEVGGKGKMMINNRPFEFNQVHFHSKSEHTIDGKHYPLEAHFVNIADNGRIAVVGVMLEEGRENRAFTDILDNIGNTQPPRIQLSDLIPNHIGNYHYLGSLTTPPLAENVEWYILKKPMTISKAQIERFQKYYDFNNRKTQPINGRAILTRQ